MAKYRARVVIVSDEIELTSALCVILGLYLKDQLRLMDERSAFAPEAPGDALRRLAENLGLPPEQVVTAAQRLSRELEGASVVEERGNPVTQEDTSPSFF